MSELSPAGTRYAGKAGCYSRKQWGRLLPSYPNPRSKGEKITFALLLWSDLHSISGRVHYFPTGSLKTIFGTTMRHKSRGRFWYRVLTPTKGHLNVLMLCVTLGVSLFVDKVHATCFCS